VQHDSLMKPIISPKYNIAFVIKGCNMQSLHALEPWCDRVYVEDEMRAIVDDYIQQEQPNTTYDLTKRVFCLGYNDPYGENDIVVEFSMKLFTQQSFHVIQQLSDIITESGEIGEFELDCFKITIANMQTYEKELIVCNTSY